MLFTGLGRSVWEKTVPLVLSTALGLRPSASGRTQDLGHSFFPYGPPARQITYIYLTLDDDFWRIQRPMDNSIVAEWANLFLNKVHFSFLISPHESNEKSYRKRTLPREKIFDIAFLL